MDPNIQELTDRLREKEALLSQEIEKRKVIEKKLDKTRETLKQALREMPVIIYVTDDDGSLVFFNREFERTSGYDAEDLADNPEILQLLFQIDEHDVPVEPEASGEWSFRSKDGSEKVVYWSSISEYPPIPGWKSWKVGVDISELKAAQAKVKVLSGLLPICANCKKIRDDRGYWNQIEGYIRDHSEAEFSHGICPTCARKLYPGLFKDDK
ncbi:MAG: PAS domain S-box protein [Desulfobacterales bacterium]|nr:MAG: PAS domain S-box protein [Desulfobacterales bacterium]